MTQTFARLSRLGLALALALGLTLPTAASAQSLINVNTASSQELQALPGVGPVRAEAIVQYREQNGPFRSVDDLINVSGIGPATLNNVRPLVTVGEGDEAPAPPAPTEFDEEPAIDLTGDDPGVGQAPPGGPEPAAPSAEPAAPAGSGGLINVNTATAEELQALPGVGPARASAIIQHREQNGPFGSVEDLTNVSGIGPATLNNIRPLVTVE